MLSVKKLLILCSSIEVKSYNRRERRDIYNVIGIMKGETEPGRRIKIAFALHKILSHIIDRYIVMGNHR